MNGKYINIKIIKLISFVFNVFDRIVFIQIEILISYIQLFS